MGDDMGMHIKGLPSLALFTLFFALLMSAMSVGASNAAGLPSVSMSVDRDVIDTSTGAARINVSVSYPLDPWTVEVRDDTGMVLARGTQGATLQLAKVMVSPPVNTSRAYTTYLVRPGRQEAMASVTVANAGYDGTVSLAADQQQGTPGATTKLRFSASAPLGLRYTVSVYDSGQHRLASGISGAIPPMPAPEDTDPVIGEPVRARLADTLVQRLRANPPTEARTNPAANPAAGTPGSAFLVLPMPEILPVSTYVCGDPNAR